MLTKSWSVLEVEQPERKFRQPTEQERLEEFFRQLEYLIPNPPRDWAKAVRPCKWAKILEEKKNNPDGSGRQ
jgi:hypothetical protein